MSPSWFTWCFLLSDNAVAAAGPCSVASFGAVADNNTDNTEAFRRATASDCTEIVVEPGVWLTGPFNLSSNTVLNVMKGATISGSRNPSKYPIVTQLPLDEAYRYPHFNNGQYQALIAAYGAHNISVMGGGIIDGQGWDWWRNFTTNSSSVTWAKQRPKLVEFVDSKGIMVSNLTLMNSPFWTLHPIFCNDVTISHLQVLAPRDHGNTDGVDPSSCDNVYVADCTIDVGDDAVSVKAGLHWKTKQKVPAQNYLFERVTIVHRNFAIGSDVSGDVRNITFRHGQIGDEFGSAPWAIKLKTDSQEGGVVDGVYFYDVRIGNITYCGSSKFVYEKNCEPGHENGATMINVGMGYGGLPSTNPGQNFNIFFEGLYGVGPSGIAMNAHGLNNASQHIVNLTLRNISLDVSPAWRCSYVDGVVVDNVVGDVSSCVGTASLV